MTITQLLREFRTQRLADTVEPYLWADTELYTFLDAAQTAFFDVVGWVNDTASLTFAAGEDSVARDPRFVRVLEAVLASGEALTLVPAVPLVRRTGTPRQLAVGQAVGTLVLDATPAAVTTVLLRVERRPLEVVEGKTSELEVPEAHQRLLHDYMEYRAYSKPDSDTFDPRRAERALLAFNAGASVARGILLRGTLPVMNIVYGGY